MSHRTRGSLTAAFSSGSSQEQQRRIGTAWRVPTVGGACFNLSSQERLARVTVNDASGLKIGWYWRFMDAIGGPLAEGFSCNSATLWQPSGASTLQVFVEETLSTIDCGSLGAGTYGRVTAAFS